MKKSIIHSTPFGPVGLVWSFFNARPCIIRIILSRPGLPADAEASRLFPSAEISSCSYTDTLCLDITAFLNGHDVEFEPGIARLDSCSLFQQEVLRTVYKIQRGYVTTYGRIADQIGRPGAARAVGNALAANPFPIVVPCHRVIRSDLIIGRYQGGSDMKLKLLEAEGLMPGCLESILL
jgi:methylated-DNA-[protein]-cysteine S-methyltransferase